MDNSLMTMLGPMLGQQAFQQGTLGNSATIGNPQGQEDYRMQLAQALAQMKGAERQQSIADSMLAPKYIDNSGLLGVIAQIAQKYAGKKMGDKADARYADATARYYKGEAAMKADEARQEAARKQAEAQAAQEYRARQADEFNLPPEARRGWILEGKLPTEVRDRLAAVQGANGTQIVNMDANTYSTPSRQGQALPANVSIDPRLPPQIRDAIAAHERSGTPIPDQLNLVQQGQQNNDLMPYKDPAIAQQQAANNARADAQLGLAYQAADDARRTRKDAEDDKKRKAQASAQDAFDTYQDAIGTIDSLRQHPGYADIGTMYGDVATSIPLVRTDAKGASAKLETLKSQIMLNTLSKLKAMSATGAAGFGALNQSEGDALRRSIANLETAQSHEDLDAAISEVRRVMERSANSIRDVGGLGGQQAPPSGNDDDLINKYLRP